LEFLLDIGNWKLEINLSSLTIKIKERENGWKIKK